MASLRLGVNLSVRRSMFEVHGLAFGIAAASSFPSTPKRRVRTGLASGAGSFGSYSHVLRAVPNLGSRFITGSPWRPNQACSILQPKSSVIRRWRRDETTYFSRDGLPVLNPNDVVGWTSKRDSENNTTSIWSWNGIWMVKGNSSHSTGRSFTRSPYQRPSRVTTSLARSRSVATSPGEEMKKRMVCGAVLLGEERGKS